MVQAAAGPPFSIFDGPDRRDVGYRTPFERRAVERWRRRAPPRQLIPGAVATVLSAHESRKPAPACAASVLASHQWHCDRPNRSRSRDRGRRHKPVSVNSGTPPPRPTLLLAYRSLFDSARKCHYPLYTPIRHPSNLAPRAPPTAQNTARTQGGESTGRRRVHVRCPRTSRRASASVRASHSAAWPPRFSGGCSTHARALEGPARCPIALCFYCGPRSGDGKSVRTSRSSSAGHAPAHLHPDDGPRTTPAGLGAIRARLVVSGRPAVTKRRRPGPVASCSSARAI